MSLLYLFRSSLFWFRCLVIVIVVLAGWACFRLGDDWWLSFCELTGVASSETPVVSDAKERFVLLSFMGIGLVTGVATAISMLTVYSRQQSQWLAKINHAGDFSDHHDAMSLVCHHRRELCTDFGFPEPYPESNAWMFWGGKLLDASPMMIMYFGIAVVIPQGSGFLSIGGIAVLLVLAILYGLAIWFPRAPTYETLATAPAILNEAKSLYRSSVLQELEFQLIDYRRESSPMTTKIVAIYLSVRGNVMVELGRAHFAINSILNDGKCITTDSRFKLGTAAYAMAPRPKTNEDNLMDLLDEHEQRIQAYLGEHDAIEVRITSENYRRALVHLSEV